MKDTLNMPVMPLHRYLEHPWGWKYYPFPSPRDSLTPNPSPRGRGEQFFVLLPPLYLWERGPGGEGGAGESDPELCAVVVSRGRGPEKKPEVRCPTE
jgi:hypothetical protein